MTPKQRNAIGKQLLKLQAERAKRRSVQRRDYAAALEYATRLATGMWERDWKKESPHWQPFDDLLGVLTQIDNMLAGMEKKKRHNDQALPHGGAERTPNANRD